MQKTLLNIVLNFVVLVLVQVLVLNNLQLLPFCNPYIYILFILSLPMSLPRWLDVVLAFAVGLTMDIFSDSLGMHCAACTLIGYLRYYVVKLYVAEEERLSGPPDMPSFGIPAYIKYVVTLTLIHHVVLFLLESFTFFHLGWLMLRIVSSSLLTIGLILAIASFKNNRQSTARHG